MFHEKVEFGKDQISQILAKIKFSLVIANLQYFNSISFQGPYSKTVALSRSNSICVSAFQVTWDGRQDI